MIIGVSQSILKVLHWTISKWYLIENYDDDDTNDDNDDNDDDNDHYSYNRGHCSLSLSLSLSIRNCLDLLPCKICRS